MVEGYTAEESCSHIGRQEVEKEGRTQRTFSFSVRVHNPHLSDQDPPLHIKIIYSPFGFLYSSESPASGVHEALGREGQSITLVDRVPRSLSHGDFYGNLSQVRQF